jgi:hypothetical protein
MMKHTRTVAVPAFSAWLILPVGLAWGQADDKEKTVFEHVIPNIEGKSMVAVVVTAAREAHFMLERVRPQPKGKIVLAVGAH